MILSVQVLTMASSSSSSDNEGNWVVHAGRGVMTMHELVHIRDGVKGIIQYNEEGEAIRESAIKIKSYIGVCVRNQIPITYQQWKHVPCDLKDKIFECIEVNILPNCTFMLLYIYYFD